MSFGYANTDPMQRRPRLGRRLGPLLIGLTIVAFAALATRRFPPPKRDANPQPDRSTNHPMGSHGSAS